MTRKTRLFLAALGTIIAAVVAYDVFRRAPEPSGAALAISTPSAPEIRRGLNKTPLLYPTEFTAQLAGDVAQAFLQVEGISAAGSEVLRGVAVSEHQVLVAPSLLPDSWRVRHREGHVHDVTSVAIDAVHGVALLTLAGSALEPLKLASPETVLNEPIVSIGVGPAVAAPLPLILAPPFTFHQLEAGLTSRLDAGAVVVSLDSTLLAFGASAAESARPIAAPRLAEIVSALQRDGRHRHPWTGVEVQTIDDRLRARFPQGALVVVHVAPSSSAPDQIVPGTVLSEVRAGRERATTKEGVERAIARSRSIAYVRLDGRALEMEVHDVQSPPGFTADGTVVAPLGLENHLTVAPMSRAAALGFRTGDVVRAIDLQPVRAVSQIEAAMRGTRDRLFTVQRGDDWRFVLWAAAGAERKP